MKWPKLPEQPPPPPVRIVGASRRGDFNFGMYANVEKQVAAMMEQGYWPLGLTFKDDFPQGILRVACDRLLGS